LDGCNLPQVLVEIPWFHNVFIVEKIKDPAERLWYAQQTIANGWSRAMLVHWIDSGLYGRRGRAITNFKTALPAPQSDLAAEIIRDPYNFDFLGLRADAAERELERGLLAHIRRFLLELGAGFAFVGQQVPGPTAPRRRRTWPRWTAGIGLVMAVAAVGLAVWIKHSTGLYGSERRAWKDQAIVEIERTAADNKGLAAEVEKLKAACAADPEGEAWASPQLLLMKNGDYLVYANICAKEDVRIPDIFIGRGSDGKWYYSTFHFCVGAMVLMMGERPASLQQFVDWYYLEEFDGRSDKCLERTWPRSRASDPKAAERGMW
jgi:predicted nuclease of restriction endonuclease-like (RecB) superfamily